jgi:hypothetical protein
VEDEGPRARSFGEFRHVGTIVADYKVAAEKRWQEPFTAVIDFQTIPQGLISKGVDVVKE